MVMIIILWIMKPMSNISLPKDSLSDIIDFLIENTSVDILFDGDTPLEVRIPQHMNFIVIETEQGEKGNTATGATKPAELETGLIIQCSFIY